MEWEQWVKWVNSRYCLGPILSSATSQLCDSCEAGYFASLMQWFSKCSSQISSMGIIQELARNKEFQAPSQPTESDTMEVRHRNLYFIKPSR